MEEESEIAKNEIMDLDIWEEAANMDGKEEISKMREIKEKEKERFEYPSKEDEEGNRKERFGRIDTRPIGKC